METKNENQPSKEEIIERLKAVGTNQRKIALHFGKRPQQVTQALNGEQPGLLKKILRRIERLERRMVA